MTTILAFLFYSFILLISKLIRESIEPSPKICEEPLERVCPTCGSEHLIKNGLVHNGKPKYHCSRARQDLSLTTISLLLPIKGVASMAEAGASETKWLLECDRVDSSD